MPNPVRPYTWQPTRLPHPWDSPGKNTGVGCHFLLQCMKVKSESEVAQSCTTLSDPMDCSPPGFTVHGILQARALEWVAMSHYLFTRLFIPGIHLPCARCNAASWQKIRGNNHGEITMLTDEEVRAVPSWGNNHTK